MNADALGCALLKAERRVREMRTKLHCWSSWKSPRRRYCAGRWWPADDEVVLFRRAKVRADRYLYRENKIPSPWPSGTMGGGRLRGACGDAWRSGTSGSGCGLGKPADGNVGRASRSDLTSSLSTQVTADRLFQRRSEPFCGPATEPISAAPNASDYG
ncbi:hypothetical protein Save01_08206 [Streptomyces avermitilis]|uniref:Uncharacterized protein n=1 Tax=Streptomyces avermitilis TaxID=33903 RepID=A0A4D4N8V8_STRAX|nr:hypothetical protein SAVMC3_05660 [Streptomyces avermitilis]GDY69695.1 hypothetical protein SAV14893_090880 [Streptomyces avermitilis]GDY79949.1 hypothetical protein SAV31267_094340 [Streptomyces avermitilis]